MNATNLTSFIIPCCNSMHTIERCLKSIKNTDYPRDCIEIVIVDNGSKDNTIDVCRKFTDRIFIDAAATISKLRNMGARKAKGNFLVFIDSDCVISKDWLKCALGHFKDSNVGLAGSKTYTVPDEAGWIEKTWKIHLDRCKDEKDTRWVVSRAIGVKKDTFLAAGGFDESLETCEDVDFGYRVGYKYNVISDEKLAPLHLKYTKFLSEFFKSESWRGKDSLKVSLKHIKEKKEMLSIAFLLYYSVLCILLLPAVVLGLIRQNAIYPIVVSAGIVAPIVYISFDTCRKANKFSYFHKLFILYGTYILARMKGAISAWRKKEPRF